MRFGSRKMVKHFLTFELVAWKITLIRMLRVGNTARDFAATGHPKNTIILWFIAIKWIMILF
jgi:hypothetical protein